MMAPRREAPLAGHGGANSVSEKTVMKAAAGRPNGSGGKQLKGGMGAVCPPSSLQMISTDNPLSTGKISITSRWEYLGISVVPLNIVTLLPPPSVTWRNPCQWRGVSQEEGVIALHSAASSARSSGNAAAV